MEKSSAVYDQNKKIEISTSQLINNPYKTIDSQMMIELNVLKHNLAFKSEDKQKYANIIHNLENLQSFLANTYYGISGEGDNYRRNIKFILKSYLHISNAFLRICLEEEQFIDILRTHIANKPVSAITFSFAKISVEEIPITCADRDSFYPTYDSTNISSNNVSNVGNGNSAKDSCVGIEPLLKDGLLNEIINAYDEMTYYIKFLNKEGINNAFFIELLSCEESDRCEENDEELGILECVNYYIFLFLDCANEVLEYCNNIKSSDEKNTITLSNKCITYINLMSIIANILHNIAPFLVESKKNAINILLNQYIFQDGSSYFFDIKERSLDGNECDEGFSKDNVSENTYYEGSTKDVILDRGSTNNEDNNPKLIIQKIIDNLSNIVNLSYFKNEDINQMGYDLDDNLLELLFAKYGHYEKDLAISTKVKIDETKDDDKSIDEFDSENLNESSNNHASERCSLISKSDDVDKNASEAHSNIYSSEFSVDEESVNWFIDIHHPDGCSLISKSDDVDKRSIREASNVYDLEESFDEESMEYVHPQTCMYDCCVFSCCCALVIGSVCNNRCNIM